MQTKVITMASQVPQPHQRAAKIALSVGASVTISNDGEQLLAQFPDCDSYYFDPEHTTLHMLEVLNAARAHGFVMYATAPDANNCAYVRGRAPLVVRVIYSNEDVRVQIGASRWYAVKNTNTAIAMRHALADALVDYYDAQIQPFH